MAKQDGGLQPIVLDRVHGAGRPGTVLVGGAGVIYIFAAQTPGQGLATVGVAEKTTEQVNAGVPLQKAL